LKITPIGTVLARSVVVTGVLVLGAGQLVETVLYIRAKRYDGVSPYAVVEIPPRQGFFLLLVLFAVIGIDSTGTRVVGAFVLAKMLSDYAGLRSEASTNSRLTGWLVGPDGKVERALVEVSDDPPTATVVMNRWLATAAAI
jgi:hypothetical protein